MRRAIIIGHTGQDGRILWEQLVAQGFSLIGVSRLKLRMHEAQWNETVDVADARAVRKLVSEFQPDHIYYLSAHHHSSQEQAVDEAAIWRASWTVHVEGLLHVLNAVNECHPSARVFYAGSSRVFGHAKVSPQNEDARFQPTCVYGATKAMGIMLAGYHRRSKSAFASCGILFNHESPLRGPQFVSQRVVNGLVGLKMGRISSLQIGNLSARVDWGYAPDYTRAMQLMLEADEPSDFVIASGKTHSVREMIEVAAEILGLNWESSVIENDQILRRNPQELCGDPSRLYQLTGWQPSTSFREMVNIMVKAALNRAELAE